MQIYPPKVVGAKSRNFCSLLCATAGSPHWSIRLYRREKKLDINGGCTYGKPEDYEDCAYMYDMLCLLLLHVDIRCL